MKGLTNKVVLEIAKRKAEPKWMTDLRLLGLSFWKKIEMPTWAPDISELKLAEIQTYVDPKAEMVDSWEKVPTEIKNIFEELGIPEAERKDLAGVGAQYDSEVIYHNLKKQVEQLGVIYLPMEEAVKSNRIVVFQGREWQISDLVKKHFMRLVPPNDHKFAALHAAVWSGGSFIFVPAGTGVEIPLQSYYRFNAPGAGQFEHTLIIVDEGAWLYFIEGCSAPKYNVANLHAGCVEIYVGKNAHVKFSTVESWSKNMYNLNTKRAAVAEDGEIEWVTGSFGSKVSMLYPTTILEGARSRCEYTGVTFAGKGQVLDNGAKVIHLAPETSSIIRTKSLSKDDGISISRTLAKISEAAKGAKAYIDCKSIILNEGARAEAIPEVKVDCMESDVVHEASVGKFSEEMLFYLMSRGVTEEQAKTLLVRGFTSEVIKELPIEYAMEMNSLIRMEMKGNA